MLLLNHGVALVLFLTCVLYFILRIVQVSVHSDPAGTAFGVLVTALSLSLFAFLHTQVLQVGVYMVSFYSATFGALCPIVYLYAQAAYIMDKRRHQLVKVSGVVPVTSSSADGLWKFVVWTAEIIFRKNRSFCFFPEKPGNFKNLEICTGNFSPKGITVINETLKRVKVCLYDEADYPCWVPAGGIGGPGVGFISAGESLILHPPCPPETFKLKLFSPGVIDQELGLAIQVARGDVWALRDVHRRIRKLVGISRSPSPWTPDSPLPIKIISDDEDEEDEAVLVFSPPKLNTPNKSSCTLKRNPSSFHSNQPDRTNSPVNLTDNLTIRNGSTLSVSVEFFRENANSYLRPILSVLGERRLSPNSTQVFTPPDDLKTFSMRVVFDGGDQDFCTVISGNSYLITDGLID